MLIKNMNIVIFGNLILWIDKSYFNINVNSETKKTKEVNSRELDLF